MKKPTPVLFVRQKHDAKRAGLHYDYRIVIDDKAFSWASKKEFPEVGKPTILWEQPTHDAKYATTPSIVIPEGQYGAGTQVIDYAQKGSSQTINNDYHLELNNGDRFLIKKAPEHYGEKAWLFLRKKALDDKNPYLEKMAAKSNESSVAMEGYAGLGLAAGSKYLGKKVAGKMKPAIELHRANYMAKAKAAGKPFSKEYMSELVAGASKNVKMVDRANLAAKITRKTAVGAGVGLIGHAAYRAYKGHDKKASESNVFLEKAAKKRETGDGARELVVGGFGAHLTTKAPGKLLGYHTAYHGTSKENAKNILKNGLNKAHGGTRGSIISHAGQSAQDHFVNNAKKHVYMTRSKLVGMTFAGDSAKHINDAGGATGAATYNAVKDGLKNGKVLKARLSHNQWKKGFKMDPDSFDMMTRLSHPEATLKHTAARSTKNVKANQFVGGEGSKGISRFATKNNLRRYYGSKTGKARAVFGAAQLIGGAALAAGAVAHNRMTGGVLSDKK